MIRTDVDPVDLMKSILHVGEFTTQFKCRDSLPIHWGIGIYDLRCIFFFTLTLL